MIKYLTLIALSTSALAQVFTPPPSPTQGASDNSNATQRSSADPFNDNQSSGNNKFGNSSYSFGDEIPLLNPGDETITIGGVTMPLGDNRIIKSRFEKYLNQPASDIEEARQYHATLDKIVELLSPKPGERRSRQDKIEEAFSLLPLAATYPEDAKLCQTLAETIYASLQAKSDVNQMSRLNNALEKKRKDLGRQADWMKRTATGSALGESKRLGENDSSQGAAGKTSAQAQVMSSQKYLGIMRDLTEIELSRKKHAIQSEKQILQTKMQFQASMMQWMMQRRFHHVIIASRFYNVLWQDGDTTLHIKQDATMSKLFSKSLGFSPTVTALDSFANEAIRDTENAIDACIYMMDQGDLHTSSKRLLEAFAVGEYLTPLTSLDRSRKRKLQVYIRELSLLVDSIQAKDYGRARELTVKLKKDAKDFPSSKAESAISANVIASNMAISKAEKALIDEDEAGVTSAIQRATELWPTNPKLASFSQLLEQGSTISKLRSDFKRLIREQNYREIFKRQYEFAPAIANNADDMAAFQQIIKNLGTIEMALEKAASFSKAGNSYAAWEQLATLREDFPDDPKLGRQLELLAPKVADFTKALNHAQILEDRSPQQTGSAISQYLKAKSIYPNSEFAAKGITRLVNQTLGEH